MPKSSSSPPPPRGERRKDAEMPDPSSAGPFDLEQVRRLIEMMDKNGLTEISLRRGDEHWRLRRGGLLPLAAPPLATVPAPAAPQQPAAAPSPAPAAPKDDGLIAIKSPTVGTFYAAQSPEEPPFVTVGTKISPETTVCLIEAMKVFNPIPAECSGIVEAVLAKNGDAVEFGQPLFKVRP